METPREPLQAQSEQNFSPSPQMDGQAVQVQDPEEPQKSDAQDPPLQAPPAEKTVETPLQHPHPQVETPPETLQKQSVP
jgi:hypothetical protein